MAVDIERSKVGNIAQNKNELVGEFQRSYEDMKKKVARLQQQSST